MKKILLAILTASIGATVHAKTPPPLRTIFLCTTTNGKQLSVYRQGKDYIYSFGRKGQKPELTFRNSRKDVIKESVTSKEAVATGRNEGALWRETNMIHKGYEYTVFWRSPLEGPDEEGVEVYKLKKNRKYGFYEYHHVATINCDKRYPFIQHAEWHVF